MNELVEEYVHLQAPVYFNVCLEGALALFLYNNLTY